MLDEKSDKKYHDSPNITPNIEHDNRSWFPENIIIPILLIIFQIFKFEMIEYREI